MAVVKSLMRFNGWGKWACIERGYCIFKMFSDTMNKKHQGYFYSLSESVFGVLDPVLCKRTGLSVKLLEYWSQIVGCDIAECTMPLRIVWSRRLHQDEDFYPATLIIACESFFAPKLMHEISELIQRINSFFGYIAINRIKIEQKQIVSVIDSSKKARTISEEDKNRVRKMLQNIENETLCQSLYELGCCIFAEKK